MSKGRRSNTEDRSRVRRPSRTKEVRVTAVEKCQYATVRSSVLVFLAGRSHRVTPFGGRSSPPRTPVPRQSGTGVLVVAHREPRRPTRRRGPTRHPALRRTQAPRPRPHVTSSRRVRRWLPVGMAVSVGHGVDAATYCARAFPGTRSGELGCLAGAFACCGH